jgi:hypothetical protein
MTPRDAKRLALGLTTLNILLGLSIVTLAIQWAVDFFLPVPHKKPKLLLEEEEKSIPEQRKELATIETFQAAWKANILEEAPKLNPKIKQPQKNAAKQRQEAILPYSWVSSLVHSQKKKSFAVLLDKAKGKQILVGHGQLIPGTSYKVASILHTEIKIVWDTMQCTLRPLKKDDKQKPSPKEYKNKWLGLDKH